MKSRRRSHTSYAASSGIAGPSFAFPSLHPSAPLAVVVVGTAWKHFNRRSDVKVLIAGTVLSFRHLP